MGHVPSFAVVMTAAGRVMGVLAKGAWVRPRDGVRPLVVDAGAGVGVAWGDAGTGFQGIRALGSGGGGVTRSGTAPRCA